MPLYRKKPVVIEAIQWDGSTKSFSDITEMSDEDVLFSDNSKLVIPTLEGEMYASVGDYIIKGVKGELYPCKPDIFEATYSRETFDEPVETANIKSRNESLEYLVKKLGAENAALKARLAQAEELAESAAAVLDEVYFEEDRVAYPVKEYKLLALRKALELWSTERS